MKKSFFLTIAITLLATYSNSQSNVTVSQGTIPTIDGTISIGEWDDAVIKTYQAGTSPNVITVTVYMKHNGSDTLYLAQDIPNLLSGDRDLVMFDKNNDGGIYPKADDIQLNQIHMATSIPSFESQGNGSDWAFVTPTGWRCSVTGNCWSSDHGQIEFAVPFSKIGITSGITKTIGFSIAFGDYVYPYDPSVLWKWPTNANPYSPNTWGDMNITFTTDISEMVNNNEITISPNPATENIKIETPQKGIIEIINIEGQIIKRIIAADNQIDIDISNFTRGMYFVNVTTDKEITMRKIIKE